MGHASTQPKGRGPIDGQNGSQEGVKALDLPRNRWSIYRDSWIWCKAVRAESTSASIVHDSLKFEDDGSEINEFQINDATYLFWSHNPILILIFYLWRPVMKVRKLEAGRYSKYGR